MASPKKFLYLALCHSINIMVPKTICKWRWYKSYCSNKGYFDLLSLIPLVCLLNCSWRFDHTNKPYYSLKKLYLVKHHLSHLCCLWLFYSDFNNIAKYCIAHRLSLQAVKNRHLHISYTSAWLTYLNTHMHWGMVFIYF